jgi:mycothiol synthase
MQRPTLDLLPEIELAPGYTIRTSQDGDGPHWARIIRESFADESYNESRFENIMRCDPAYQPDRIFFVCAPDGLPCGTASAYRNDSFGPDMGYLHFVGVCSAHTGKRLGSVVSLIVLKKFLSEGLKGAVLYTDDFRLAAIQTYLNLGFSPKIVDENQPARWNTVFTQLGLPLLYA